MRYFHTFVCPTADRYFISSLCPLTLADSRLRSPMPWPIGVNLPTSRWKPRGDSGGFGKDYAKSKVEAIAETLPERHKSSYMSKMSELAHRSSAIFSLEALRPLGYHLADPATAHDGQRFSLELLPHELLPLPLALLHRDVRLRNSPGIDTVVWLIVSAQTDRQRTWAAIYLRSTRHTLNMFKPPFVPGSVLLHKT